MFFFHICLLYIYPLLCMSLPYISPLPLLCIYLHGICHLCICFSYRCISSLYMAFFVCISSMYISSVYVLSVYVFLYVSSVYVPSVYVSAVYISSVYIYIYLFRSCHLYVPCLCPYTLPCITSCIPPCSPLCSPLCSPPYSPPCSLSRTTLCWPSYYLPCSPPIVVHDVFHLKTTISPDDDSGTLKSDGLEMCRGLGPSKSYAVAEKRKG